ncbi:MAG: hypothetical protein ONB46_03655 [candidate division KSB1 bacterium]|nr:hypothetical protein [candidate division KSB1 bacterium]MDZ7364984.1 hypothetical protein [candidate division KSB1 bacterium]MDZ7403379.1 hypothetical protein [candidate division KSB1 bacterium]
MFKAAAYNLWFNVARKNSFKGHKTPWEIVKERQANIHPAVAAWQRVFLDEIWRSKLGAEQKRGTMLFRSPVFILGKVNKVYGLQLDTNNYSCSNENFLLNLRCYFAVPAGLSGGGKWDCEVLWDFDKYLTQKRVLP